MRQPDDDLRERVEVAARVGGPVSDLSPAEWVGHADLALELTERFAGGAGEFEQFAADQDFAFDEWLLNLPVNLASAGLVDEAVRVADALAGVDVRFDRDYACDAASILARAGRGELARVRVEANLAQFGDDPYAWVASGEALAALGDLGRP